MADHERELRQFRLMEKRLNQFVEQQRPIDQTIADLEGLFWALEETSDEWKERFQDLWGRLEIAYAVALDRGDPIPNAGVPELRQAADEMLALVHERIAALDSD